MAVFCIQYLNCIKNHSICIKTGGTVILNIPYLEDHMVALLGYQAHYLTTAHVLAEGLLIQQDGEDNWT